MRFRVKRFGTTILIISLTLAVDCGLMPWVAPNFANRHIGQFYAVWFVTVAVCLAVKGKYAKLSLIGIPVALFPFLFILVGGVITGDWP
jgi:predicted membrane channel-forming protein YqfA (hemolysin III family)